MPRSSSPFPRGVLVAIVALAALAAVVVLVIRRGQVLPDGPEPVAWNRAPCAHCHMLVGEPPHAAQLVTIEGEVLAFDDPGCLLQYLADQHPAVHRMWFHHAHEGRWVSSDDVAFLSGGTTPMGHGLLAVTAGTPGAIGLEEAQRRVASTARSDLR